MSRKRTRKRLKSSLLLLLSGLCILGIIAILLIFSMNPGIAEGGQPIKDDAPRLMVTASVLNGRAWPRKTAHKEAFWDDGDWVYSTGKWSDDRKWVEVYGGEAGTCWCYVQYLNERTESFKALNECGHKVKIRKTPVDGKVTGYLKNGKTVTITQVVLGWGKCKTGWIDLGYLVELENEDN